MCQYANKPYTTSGLLFNWHISTFFILAYYYTFCIISIPFLMAASFIGINL